MLALFIPSYEHERYADEDVQAKAGVQVRVLCCQLEERRHVQV